jgi:ankyrin repeat protein
MANHIRIVQLLLEDGWDVNAPDGDGNRPLHVAAATGNARIGQWLLDRGANPNHIDVVIPSSPSVIHYSSCIERLKCID